MVTFPKPEGKPAFTAPWFRWFLPNLTLPESTEDNPAHMRWEGHLLLMTEEFFRPELIHLLVVIPKGNMKTTWEAALAVWHMLTVQAPRAYCGAADKGQAKELYGFASHFAESVAWIARRLLVRDSTLEIRRGRRGIFKVLASDESRQGGKKQGLNLTLGLSDEEHAHENDNLTVDLSSGGFKRRNAAKIAGDPNWHAIGKDSSITTAGHLKDGPLGQRLRVFLGDPETGTPPLGTVETGLRVLPDGSVEKHPDGRLTIARSPTGGSVLLQWASDPKRDSPDDIPAVKLASPASTVTVESLADSRERLTLSQFMRYHMDLWTDVEESWLEDGAWDALTSPVVPSVVHQTWEDATCLPAEAEQIPEPEPEFEEFIKSLYPPGTPIVGALDMARYRDCAAVTLIGRPEYAGGRKVPRTIVWKSGGQEKPVRYDWPKTAIRRLHYHYNLLALGADEKYADQLMEELANEGIAIEPFPQSNERIGPADTELRKEVLSDPPEFVTDGDPILASHVIAGKIQDLGERLIKIVQQDGPKPPPIDACRALSMANALAKFEHGITDRDLFGLGEEIEDDEDDE